jgi:hypothetical protein
VTVYYTLPNSNAATTTTTATATATASFVDKELVVCQLDSAERDCDRAPASAVTVLNETIWDGLHRLL